MFNNKTILITGGTGSFGKKFIEIISKKFKPKKIIIYSRDELKQFEMQKRWPFKNSTPFRYFIGDVRDLERLKVATKEVDIVIHAAALKHVTVGEYNPFEVIKTNIIGAQNIIDASIYSGVKKVIALSTDKAAAPINLYGASKLAADKLFVAANNYTGKKNIIFSVVRYGNVMGSRGSVIPIFLEQKKRGALTITHKDMTRFNITLEEGVNFVINCAKVMIGGEIFVPKIPSYKVIDVAKAIAPNAKISFTGIRPGEKIHEEMITQSDSVNAIEFNKYYTIVPNNQFVNLKKKNLFLKSGKKCKIGFSYDSFKNKNYLSIKQIKNLIIKNVPESKNIL
jgi:UDP-N-acetylglucosamine 4,6-dehydratase/5-epimerase